MRESLLIVAATLSCAAAAPACVLAQSYPSGMVRIVVPSPPGGLSDRLARMLSEKLRVRWNQTVIVENRAGASGMIGSEYVANSAPDGHTLLYGFNREFATGKMLLKNLTFDPDAFVPVSVLTSIPVMMIAHPTVKAETLQQVIALAKSNPGRLNYSTAGNASTLHLTGELFNAKAGVKTTHIPFNGTAPALTAVLAGQVELMFVEFSTALRQIQAGKLRPIAIGSEKRNPVLPNVATFSEAIPGFAAAAWGGIAASPGTSPGVAGLISSAIVEALRQPDIAKYLSDSYIESVGSTPSEMAMLIKQEKARWGEVVKSIDVNAN